jgi:hypothetical protein
LDVALQRTDAAGVHALARLGGPFLRVYTYTRPEDARQQLGALLLAASRHGEPAQVSGVWRLADITGVHEQAFSIAALTADTILACPFIWDGRVQTMQWSVDVEITWRNQTLRQSYNSPALFPSIGTWRTLARPTADTLAIDDLIDADGHVSPTLGWTTHEHNPGQGEFQNLSTIFNVPLRDHAWAAPGSDLTGYAATTLHSPDVRTLCINYQAARPVQIYLNGALIAEAEHVETPPLGMNLAWSRSVPVTFRPGENTLLIISAHPGSAPAWHWFLHVKLTTLEGAAVPDVRTM